MLSIPAKKYIKFMVSATLAVSIVTMSSLGSFATNPPVNAALSSTVTDGAPLCAPSVTVSNFTDVSESDWFYSYLEPLIDDKIFLGTSETSFEPDELLSAVQLFALITRYLGIEDRASEARSALITAGAEGADLWYSGYVKLLADGGILSDSDYGIKISGETVAISPEAERQLDARISRAETAKLLSLSFELDSLHAPNGNTLNSCTLYPQISLYGHEYIRGGMYPSAELEKYASLIKDYCSIPESSRLYVLKCYYDGIFNGDENGCFNPGDPLKRCEAAKLIAAIIYRNLRASADLRENSTKFSEDDYTYDSNGVKQLKPEALEKLLDACRNFFTIESGTKNELVINAKSTLPEGYTCEILVSRYLYGRNYRAYHFGLSIKDSASDDTAANKRVLLAYQGVPCEATVLIMLRNQLDSGEIEAVSEYRIGKDLSVKLLSRQTRSAV